MALGVLLLLAGGCRVQKDPVSGGEQTGVSDFCLGAGDFSMEVVEEHCDGYGGQRLSDIGGINGGFEDYVDQGVREFVFQVFSGSDGAEISSYVMDFGTADNAGAMVDDREVQPGGDVLPWNDPPFTAVMKTTGGGVVYNVYAHHGQWYFELQLQAVQGDDDARQRSRQLLLTYQTKM
jgi:hypothetical protein